MGRERAVLGRDRPLVVVDVDVRAARRDHRLDRDRHPLREQRTAPGLPEVRDVRVLVVGAADAVADEAADDREPVAPRRSAAPPLRCRRRGCRARAWAIPSSSAFCPASSSARAPLRDLADAERVRAVRDEPVQRDADVDRDDVALRDHVRAGDPVHDDVVRRDADRGRIAAVPERCGHAAARADEVLRDRVELAGRDARLEPLADVRDRLGDQAARLGHLLDLVG